MLKVASSDLAAKQEVAQVLGATVAGELLQMGILVEEGEETMVLEFKVISCFLTIFQG